MDLFSGIYENRGGAESNQSERESLVIDALLDFTLAT